MFKKNRDILNGSSNSSKEMEVQKKLTNQSQASSLFQKYYQSWLRDCSSNLTLLMVKITNFDILYVYYNLSDIEFFIKSFTKRMKSYKNDYFEFVKLSQDTYIIALNKDNSLSHFDVTFDNQLSRPIISNKVNFKPLIKLSAYKVENTTIKSNCVLNYLYQAIHLPNFNKYKRISIHNGVLKKRVKRKKIITKSIISIIEGSKKSSIVMHYQPIIDSRTNEIIGFEALSRLKIGHFDLIYPDEFIDLAEKRRLIASLTHKILEASFEGFKLIKNSYPNTLLSINISIHELIDDSFITSLDSLKDKYSLSSNEIGIEITESTLIENLHDVKAVLNLLRQKGYRLILDDFGTGFSSLASLVDIPLDIVKIDQSFVKKLTDDFNYETFFSGIIFTIQSLGLKTVVEGIETASQYAFIKRIGCNYSQGYYFSKPLVLSDLTQNGKILKTLNTINHHPSS